MSEQSEALRLADELQRNVIQTDHDDQVVLVPRWTVEGAIEEIRRQHARIDADEALMRQALEALANRYDETLHTVPQIKITDAITALRSRLETTNAS